MNDDTETVPCPVCHKPIVVALEYQQAEWDTGIREGWIGGIAIESSECFDHLSYEQVDAVVDAAIAEHGSEPPGYGNEEAWARLCAEEIDEMHRHHAWEMARADAAGGDEIPF
jgi:hypothetical protein